MCVYKYKGASYSLSFPRCYCVYLQNMSGYYELSPPSCVLPLPSPLPRERGVGGEQRKDSTVGFPFFSFYQPSEVRMLLAPLCVRARAVHLATESRSSRQQNYLATCVCACVREEEGGRERKNGLDDVLCCCMWRVPSTEVLCTSRDGSNRCRCSASHWLPPTESSFSAQHIAFFNIGA